MTHIFIAEQLIIERLTALIPAFKTVDNPSLIAGLTDIGPLLPACFVMPGAGENAAQQQNGAGVVEDQSWQLIVITAHQAFKLENKLTEDIAGALIQSCIQAMSGWKPENADFVRPFIYAGRSEPEYNLGYAEFPLTFKIKRMLIP